MILFGPLKYLDHDMISSKITASIYLILRHNEYKI